MAGLGVGTSGSTLRFERRLCRNGSRTLMRSPLGVGFERAPTVFIKCVGQGNAPMTADRSAGNICVLSHWSPSVRREFLPMVAHRSRRGRAPHPPSTKAAEAILQLRQADQYRATPQKALHHQTDGAAPANDCEGTATRYACPVRARPGRTPRRWPCPCRSTCTRPNGRRRPRGPPAWRARRTARRAWCCVRR